MRAVAVRRGESSPSVVERPRPDPEPGEALVETHRVGVDGTDHAILAGHHGGFPEGSDELVLGHEAVGRVADANDTGFSEGDVVVPMVRRPPPSGTNEYFERGEPDMAPPGAYVERGIEGADGYMAEYFTAPEAYLVPVPEDLYDLGFLVEPVSNAVKAIEHARAARSAFEWEQESALVLGNGPLGLLTLAILDAERTYCLGRRDRPDPTVDVIEALGATYVDSRETPVPDVPDAHEAVDAVYEATGHAPHAFEAVEALAPNGVAALLGVPERGWEFEVPGSDLHHEMVMQNKAVLGSVNSGRGHFERAVEHVESLSEGFLDRFVTGVYGFDDLAAAFDEGDTTIKTAVQVRV
ncbi:MAG: glucose 1-dehydrogenase [Halobacteriaceae archaeon]